MKEEEKFLQGFVGLLLAAIVLIVLLFTSSCSTVQKTVTQVHAVKDTTTQVAVHKQITTTEAVDTTIKLKADTSASDHVAPAEIDFVDSSETPKQKTVVKIHNGKSSITTIIKPVDVSVNIHKTTTATIDSAAKTSVHTDTTTKEKDKTVQRFPWWLLILIILGVLVVVLLLTKPWEK